MSSLYGRGVLVDLGRFLLPLIGSVLGAVLATALFPTEVREAGVVARPGLWAWGSALFFLGLMAGLLIEGRNRLVRLLGRCGLALCILACVQLASVRLELGQTISMRSFLRFRQEAKEYAQVKLVSGRQEHRNAGLKLVAFSIYYTDGSTWDSATDGGLDESSPVAEVFEALRKRVPPAKVICARIK